jgi:hypothetical protein
MPEVEESDGEDEPGADPEHKQSFDVFIWVWESSFVTVSLGCFRVIRKIWTDFTI